MKVLLFLLLFWAAGVVLAIYFGLGWFFLLESLRRLATYISPLNRKMRYLLLGKEEPSTIETQTTNPNAIFLSKFFRLIILLGWIVMTIVVFNKINIPLVEFFSP
jgi:hypothetical protein